MSDQESPSSYYGDDSEQWTCIFPGKMGISWKRSWDGHGTKEEAEAVAAKNRNVIAVPLALWLRHYEYERRTVEAERMLLDGLGLRADYHEGQVTFVQVRRSQELDSVHVN